MSFDRPPKDASVDNLLELCKVLREGGQTRDKLYDTVNQSDTLIRDNIRYGVGLGFLHESEEGVEITTCGVEASYNQDAPEDLAQQFREGIKEYKLYRFALKELFSEDFSAEGTPITKSDVLRVFRTSVGLEGSEKTLGDAATTFIKTLGAAGLGKYIVGRGGNETRLELYEDFDRLVEQIIVTQELEPEPETGSVEQEGVGQPQPPVERVAQPTVDTSSSPIQINIELSGDEDPNKIEDLIIGVRRGLTRNLSDFGCRQSSEEEITEEASDGSEADPTDQD